MWYFQIHTYIFINLHISQKINEFLWLVIGLLSFFFVTCSRYRKNILEYIIFIRNQIICDCIPFLFVCISEEYSFFKNNTFVFHFFKFICKSHLFVSCINTNIPFLLEINAMSKYPVFLTYSIERQWIIFMKYQFDEIISDFSWNMFL